jgi:hypothetical protein
MMKKRWLWVGSLGLAAFLIWMIFVREHHPDTSSVPSYATYTEFRGDIATS